jgi:hypothetical protein
MEQQQNPRPGITIMAILTIVDGIAFLASVDIHSASVDINNNNVPPVTGTSTSGSVTIPQTLLVGMSVVTGLDGIFNILINVFIFYYIYRPYVKSFFGKATTMSAADAASLTE